MTLMRIGVGGWTAGGAVVCLVAAGFHALSRPADFAALMVLSAFQLIIAARMFTATKPKAVPAVHAAQVTAAPRAQFTIDGELAEVAA